MLDQIKRILTTNWADKRVCAPIGGFGHHVRWLLLLSKEFNEKLHTLNSIVPRIPSSTISKVDYIKKYVYPIEKTYYNWLPFERKFRHQLDPILHHNHGLYKRDKMLQDTREYSEAYFKKSLLCTCDPELCYRAYVKIRPHIGNKETFIENATFWNHSYKEYEGSKDEKVLVMDNTILFKPKLDYNYYCEIVDFFGLTPEYQAATQVHESWYFLHEKAEKDCYNFFINFDSKKDKFPFTDSFFTPITIDNQEIYKYHVINALGRK